MVELNPVVVSYCNDASRAQNLVKSCQKYEWPLRLIVEDQSWWKGWGYRLKRVLQEVDWCRSQGYTHMIHVDAYDVVVVMHAFNFTNRPDLFISTEVNCWPDPAYRNHYVYRPFLSKATPWHYAHSQFCLELSRYEAIRDCFGFGLLKDEDDDQLHMHDILSVWWQNRDRTVSLTLDTRCELFQSIAFCHPWQSYFVDLDHHIRNELTGTYPMFFHGNGKTNMQWVVDMAEKFPVDPYCTVSIEKRRRERMKLAAEKRSTCV